MKKVRMPRRKRNGSASHPLILRNAAGGDVELKRGDVIGVDRGLYEHYGVYVGNNEVIHYTTAPRRRLGKKRDLLIRKTKMAHFLKKQKKLFVLDLTDPRDPKKSAPIVMGPQRLASSDWFYKDDIDKDFHLYSPEETVERAESQLGKGEYNLIVNNCEHFSVWCKTGLHKSYQVEEVLKHIKRFFLAVP